VCLELCFVVMTKRLAARRKMHIVHGTLLLSGFLDVVRIAEHHRP
jgi:hypothetical protein